MMHTKTVTTLLVALLLACVPELPAQRQKRAPAPTTDSGRELAQRYAEQLEHLRADLRRRLPNVSEARRQQFLAALADEAKQKQALAEANKALGALGTAQALVKHAEGKWIGGADRGIAKANARLQKATTDADRKAAQQELAKWQQNRRDGEQALAERKAALAAARREHPARERAARRAKEALARAEAQVARALRSLGLTKTLARNDFDHDLARFEVLTEATPGGLAAFAEQGDAQRDAVDALLADPALMLRMVVADGASGDAYGRAMQLYQQLQTSGMIGDDDSLDRLALAIALEHATPIEQRNATARSDAPTTVDPIARFEHYAQALAAGELDACFTQLSTWDYRMVVDGNEPDEILTWGREMLRNYRPDHVYTKDDRWRYVAAVTTEIRYGSQDNQHDEPELQFFQNILKNGGVCGRRAFFGRFILRAFGVPTLARPSTGHAALAHWTPKGWVVCLGAGWGHGRTATRYKSDLDFLATTQARRAPERFLEVKRAQWLGDVAGEKPVYGLGSGKAGFWYAVSLHHQRTLIDELGDAPLAAVGEELGEADDARVDYANEAQALTDADRTVIVDRDGEITIPATACSTPKKSGGRVLFLPSNLGQKQLVYGRTGRAQELEYTFDAPKAGRYLLSARVVTPSWQQHLDVFANGSKEPVDLVLPHTVGLWGKTSPIPIDLVQGKNVLRMKHRSDGQDKGFALRDFTLVPAR